MASLRADQLFGVKHVVAVVTGGGSGIGRMIATALAENGATCVYIVGRDDAKLQRTAQAYPNIIKPLVGDVTSQESLRAAASRVQQEIGYINFLAPNAGIAGPGLKGLTARPTVADFVRVAWSSSSADFNHVYGLNCTAMYYTILAFLELLDQGNKRHPDNPKSQVVATASMAGFLRDSRYGFAYSSSKAAVISLIKTFATYCVPWGIRFNAIALGLFPSDMSAPLLVPFKINKDKDICDEGALARTYIPAERAGSDEDIAGVLLYLVSRAGSYMNGSVLLVDGGKVATMPATY